MQDDFQLSVLTQFRIPAGLENQSSDSAFGKVIEEFEELEDMFEEVRQAIREGLSEDQIQELLDDLEMEYGDLEVTIAGVFEALKNETGLDIDMQAGREAALDKITRRVSIGGHVDAETGHYVKP